VILDLLGVQLNEALNQLTKAVYRLLLSSCRMARSAIGRPSLVRSVV
jgi:hypothetical protein